MQPKRTIPRVCQRCGTDFLAARGEVNRGRALYCSPQCAFVRSGEATVLSYDGQSALIPLRARDRTVRDYAIVDAADAEWANQWAWYLGDDGYAARTETRGRQRRNLRLHRELLGLPHISDGREVDHIDRIKLNCRRNNLRVASRAENQQNQAGRGRASRHRGVTLHAHTGKWAARVSLDGKVHHLGLFANETDAAEAARAARRRLMPYAPD